MFLGCANSVKKLLQSKKCRMGQSFFHFFLSFPLYATPRWNKVTEEARDWEKVDWSSDIKKFYYWGYQYKLKRIILLSILLILNQAQQVGFLQVNKVGILVSLFDVESNYEVYCFLARFVKFDLKHLTRKLHGLRKEERKKKKRKREGEESKAER